MFAEWEGVCVQGMCYECSEPPIPSLPFIFCNDGRTCKLNKEVYTPTGIMSLNYLFDLPVSLGTVIMLSELVIAIIALLLGMYGVGYYKYQSLKYQKQYSNYISLE